MPVDGGFPDGRRQLEALRLALAGLWLLDAALQFQPFMFTKGFGRSLAATAAGNPAVLADPITWAARLVGQYPVAFNTVFAAVQLLIAAGIAWRRTVRPALAASIAWSLAVWWLGEGFGGLFAGTATPLSGAPGAVFLYGLLAVLLWPAGAQGRHAGNRHAGARHAGGARHAVPAERLAPAFPAARAVGAPAARMAWLVLWAVLAVTAVLPGSDGTLGPLVLATGLTLVAAGVYLPPRAARTVLIGAVGLSAYIWVAGEAFGGILTGQATDPNTGPLLVVLALAYWPDRVSAARGAPVPLRSSYGLPTESPRP